MLTEKEFQLLTLLKKNSFLKREDFESDEAFDYACEMARVLLDSKLLHTSANQPFRKNNTGQGSKYAIAGAFSLSTLAIEAVALDNYKSYKKIQPRESKWGLGNRLTVLSIIVALLGAIIAIVYA